MNELLQFDKDELKYLEEFKMGNYLPELLFKDKDVVSRIKNHPMAIWKTMNK